VAVTREDGNGRVTLEKIHIDMLNHVPLKGGTRQSLGELLERPEFHELVAAGYIEYRPFVGREAAQPGRSEDLHQDLWYLTPAGADAIDVDPERIGRA
jgi:hypothetical protein